MMPGILPMKVIKVGTNAQSRIAQACDRCRSKKIRCDGVRPCCSQCANVGFECKTSDKLSRRAFPRGYTESLEERVRSLETEVRELKELLDEKDEKIDMLSRVRSQSSQPLQLPSPRRPSTHSKTSASPRADSSEKDEIFKVQQSPYLLDTFGSDSYFAGTSNARTLIEAFKHTVQESGRSTEIINTELLLASSCRTRPESPSSTKDAASFNPPSRMVSDQLVNVFFQEWAPLFPVLHRPGFLTLYERYCADPDDITDKAEQAQLYLVFGIAALSCDSKTSVQDLESFEGQWKAAVDSILSDGSMATLQAFILAQIFCVQKGDLTRLLTYKGLSTSLSARLGLHQSQKRFALGTLTCETRKKVFWSLYTVDCFTAVILGLPKHIKDEDVHCEFPVDADDEYVTEKGFQPTLPGESTKLSSALAFFRAARILSKVLEEVFPAKTSYDLSMKKLSDLQDELDAWSSSLAPHLRLQFAQDKPSTGTISSRSPLLSMTYHYIRALINRPAICAGIGNRASPAMLTHAASCKSMIQLVQLLRERGMSLSFCINRDELLVLSGFGLLYQSLNLDPQSKILKDNQKMVKAVVAILRKTNAPCAPEFSKVADAFLPSASSAASSSSATPKLQVPTISRHNSDPIAPITINPHPSLPASTKKHLKAIANRFTNATRTPRMDAATDYRRATLPNITLHPDSEVAQNQPSLQPPSSTHNRSPVARSEPARSPLNTYGRPPSTGRPSAPPATNAKHKARPPTKALNLDYLSFGPDTDVSTSSAKASQPINPDPQPTDWEKLLGSLDNGQTNIFDACYGGQPVEALLDSPALSMAAPASVTSVASASTNSINDPAWGQADLWSQLCQTETNTTAGSALPSSPGQADHHLLSFSSTDDLTASRSSADDFKVTPEWIGTITDGGSSKGSSVALGSHSGTYRGIVMPASLDSDDGLSFDSPWNSGLAL